MYYKVLKTWRGDPTPHQYGYESRHDFIKELKRLTEHYGGRTGEVIATRHVFLRLRFRDRHGAIEEAWIPHFMVAACPPPVDALAAEREEASERELERIFGY